MVRVAMYSVREVAELLGIRTHSVLKLIRAGQLVARDVSLHPGGRPTWRIDREEVEKFLIRRTHSATPRRRRHKSKTRIIKQFF